MSGNNQHSSKQKEQTCENNQLNAVKEYELIINARNFHYQEFNKWSRYFGLVVSALFVAYYTIQSPEKKVDCQLEILIALMGFIVSMCWYWSNKGYTYWWNHWSKFLHKAEENGMGGIHGVHGVYTDFAYKGEGFFKNAGRYLCPVEGSNISTSKIVLLMSFIITVAWSYVLLPYIKLYNVLLQEAGIPCRIMFCVIFTWVISLFSFLLRSDMSNHTQLIKWESSDSDDTCERVCKYIIFAVGAFLICLIICQLCK